MVKYGNQNQKNRKKVRNMIDKKCRIWYSEITGRKNNQKNSHKLEESNIIKS